MERYKNKTVARKKIVIVTPAQPGTLHGNRTTATRWAQHLLAAGHGTEVLTQWESGDQDVMIALHATRSHAAMQAWKKNNHTKPLILIMTGTDLYRDLAAGNAQALVSLEMADQIILLQPEAMQCIPLHIRSRCQVIYQSISVVKVFPKHAGCFMVTVIGHLRDEKDPLRTAIALQHIPKSMPIKIFHLGMAMQESLSAEALKLAQVDTRYQWLGQRSHQNTLRWLARSRLMVISSLMEGGAHVVSEAIALGIPVLASDIAGNRGLLGDDYQGYFPAEDDVALAKLLMRAESDPTFMLELTDAVQGRKELITPQREFNAINQLIDGAKRAAN